jgi:hypothetical protein
MPRSLTVIMNRAVIQKELVPLAPEEVRLAPHALADLLTGAAGYKAIGT